MCQNRLHCPLGISGPTLLQGSRSKVAMNVFSKVSSLLSLIRKNGIQIFQDSRRNQRFASLLARDNVVETTRAALYDYYHRLAVHVDGQNGQEQGYSGVAWASQLSLPDQLLETLLPQKHEDCYRLCQVLYSRRSVESYMRRREEVDTTWLPPFNIDT